MTTPDELNAIRDRITKGTHTKADLIALCDKADLIAQGDAVKVRGDHNVVQQGEVNINIIGEVRDIQVGDRTSHATLPLSSKVILIDASLDPHDSPYEQTIEGGIKTIRSKQKPKKVDS